MKCLIVYQTEIRVQSLDGLVAAPPGTHLASVTDAIGSARSRCCDIQSVIHDFVQPR